AALITPMPSAPPMAPAAPPPSPSRSRVPSPPAPAVPPSPPKARAEHRTGLGAPLSSRPATAQRLAATTGNRPVPTVKAPVSPPPANPTGTAPAEPRRGGGVRRLGPPVQRTMTPAPPQPASAPAAVTEAPQSTPN